VAFFTRKRFGAGRRSETGIPDGLWMKCAGCHQTVFREEVAENIEVCPACGYHYRLGAERRIAITVDPESFTERHMGIESKDPLGFAAGGTTYLERVQRAKAQTGLSEALVTGMARIGGTPVALGVMDPAFIMASMGSAVGEKFCRLVRDAVRARVPVVVFAASGGARMQEGILALMQMAKTADAVRQINEAGLPYITVLTDPTTGGVLASFASLGDVVLAEPGAYIGFAGRRLIEGSLRIKVTDESFQTSEYQYQNGFIDRIVKRSEMRANLSKLLRFLDPSAPVPAAPVSALT